MYEAQPIPAFRDNYIWLCHASRAPAVGGRTESGKAAIIDPGEAAPVTAACARLLLTPAAIFLTHGHWDHVNGVTDIVAAHDVPVYGPAHEAIPCVTHPLRDGDRVSIDPALPGFTVMEVPGHTRGHIAYYGSGMLFCGDTLFTGGCGRLLDGTAQQLYHSLQRLAALPDDTRIYCAHEYTLGNLKFALQVEPDNQELRERLRETERMRAAHAPTVPSTLGIEKNTNPFLRCHIPGVVGAVENFAGKKLRPGAEVFAALRYWKDIWPG